MSTCKGCHIAAVSDRNQKSITRKEYMRDYHLRTTYDISADEYDELLQKQNKKCAICEREAPGRNKLSVDHDHEDGHVRGLLCNECNGGLGRFRDDPNRIRRALEYLESR
mgnify:FL=1